MKKILFSFSFLFPSLFFAQRLSLAVKPDDKVTIHGFCYWQEMLVRGKDTSFVTPLHHGNPDIIKDLKAGSYTLTATSLFNDRISKKVALNKKTSLVKFKGLQKFYKRVPAEQNISEKLKMNDTLFIVFNSSADENVKEKVAVTKSKTGYKAIQYKGISNEVFQDMQFRESAYAAVVNFEKEGKRSNSPRAETAPKAEIYTIELNKEIVSFIIPGQWNGLDKLKAVLFIVEQK